MATTISYGKWASVRPANTDEAALLLAAASTEYNGVLRVCNQDSVTRTYRIAHCAATGVASGDEWLAYDKEISANDTHEWSIHLGASQEIRHKVSVADKISLHISGEKKVTS